MTFLHYRYSELKSVNLNYFVLSLKVDTLFSFFCLMVSLTYQTPICTCYADINLFDILLDKNNINYEE